MCVCVCVCVKRTTCTAHITTGRNTKQSPGILSHFIDVDTRVDSCERKKAGNGEWKERKLATVWAGREGGNAYSQGARCTHSRRTRSLSRCRPLVRGSRSSRSSFHRSLCRYKGRSASRIQQGRAAGRKVMRKVCTLDRAIAPAPTYALHSHVRDPDDDRRTAKEATRPDEH
jgi:hypothetical protein